MKRVFIILLTMLLSTSIITAQTPTYDTGISQQLAEQRSAAIKDIRYELTFNIPEGKSNAISASETLRFRLEKKQEVALDFRCDKSQIISVSKAGKKKDLNWRFENEHIIIPAQSTKVGENAFDIVFIAGNQSLNRHDDYMYTLFVPDRARTCFPCFDQPDMKARFTLHLKVPGGWKAVCNSPLEKKENGMLTFAQSEMLPTYLFAFAAGEFEYKSYTEDGRTIGAYYRETDPERIKQLPEIFRQVMYALRWQEDFTKQPYGFSKYDFVVLPGFQFGGMEHTGCTFYNDNTLFLSQNPTPDEILSRANLISHETSHMWFGDLVTMRWFNDVWTKEVFANYFAAEITRPQFPEVNFDLYWLKSFKARAIQEDRTNGRTAIQQPLDNMQNAGLIYNNIIYDKAPLVMREIVRMMGNDAFQRGIQRYVHDYAYGNATWDNLIDILDSETDADIKGYSEKWVKQPCYPTIESTTSRPDPDGRGYGYYKMTREQIDTLMTYWPTETDATARQSFLMTLYENYLHKKISDRDWIEFVIASLAKDTDPLTLSTLVADMKTPLWRLDSATRADVERRLWDMSQSHPVQSCRLQLMRFLIANASSRYVVDQLFVVWKYCETDLLSENDYMNMAYELSVRYPDLAKDILPEQRQRIENYDRIQQFDYVSRAVVADGEARDSLFQWLLVPENRRIEPWAASALYYLNHPLRDVESVKYIRPALEALQDVQRTGDIFFPGRWCKSLLGDHRSKEALDELNAFFADHPDYPQLLKNKILVAAYNLQRENEE